MPKRLKLRASDTKDNTSLGDLVKDLRVASYFAGINSANILFANDPTAKTDDALVDIIVAGREILFINNEPNEVLRISNDHLESSVAFDELGLTERSDDFVCTRDPNKGLHGRIIDEYGNPHKNIALYIHSIKKNIPLDSQGNFTYIFSDDETALFSQGTAVDTLSLVGFNYFICSQRYINSPDTNFGEITIARSYDTLLTTVITDKAGNEFTIASMDTTGIELHEHPSEQESFKQSSVTEGLIEIVLPYNQIHRKISVKTIAPVGQVVTLVQHHGDSHAFKPIAFSNDPTRREIEFDLPQEQPLFFLSRE